MPGGLQKALAGSNPQWNDRLLVLPAYTGCLHWFRDDGGAQNITTLGWERGSVRLRDVSDVELSACADEAVGDVPWRAVALRTAEGRELLTFRAEASIAAAWECAIRAAMARASERRQNGLWLQGWHDNMTVEAPPEPLKGVDAALVFHDSRLQFMGFALQMPAPQTQAACHSFIGATGLRFRLFLVYSGQLRWFEPKDRLLFGERKGALDLRSLKSVTSSGNNAVLVFELFTIMARTPWSSEWVAAIRQVVDAGSAALPREPSTELEHSASSTAAVASQQLRPSAALSAVRASLEGCSAQVLNVAFVLVLWNGSLALSLHLHGTYLFWLVVTCMNVALALRAALSQPPSLGAARSRTPSTILVDHSPPSRLLEVGPGTGCVEDGDVSTVMVRGKDYLASQKKVPSLPAFYELVRAQVVAPPSDGCRHLHVSTHEGAVLERECRSLAGPLPQFFVLNLLLPEGPPAALAARSGQAPCSSLVIYFRVREETQLAASDAASAEPAVRLLRAYCLQAGSQQALKDRMKVICHIENIGESPVPASYHKYNSKPSLVGKAGTLFEGPGYLEMDVDISGCGYMQRSLLHQLRRGLPSMELRVSVVVQGEHEEELPERLWACAHLHRVDASTPTHASSTGAAPAACDARNSVHSSAAESSAKLEVPRGESSLMSLSALGGSARRRFSSVSASPQRRR